MKIAVIGSINIDFTVTADRIPSKGETVPGKGTEIFFGGKGWNPNVKSVNMEITDEVNGEKTELVKNEQSLPMSQKRKEKYN